MNIEEKLLTEIKSLEGIIENNDWHTKVSVYSHTLKVVAHYKRLLGSKKYKQKFSEKINNFSKRDLLVICAYLHDSGKKETISIVNGKTTCPGHENMSATISGPILSKLGLSKQESEYVFNIVKNHGILNSILNNQDQTTLESLLSEYKTKYSSTLTELILFSTADTMGSELKYTRLENYRFRLKKFKRLLADPDLQK